FVIVYNHQMLTAATKEGSLDLWDLRFGHLQARHVLGKFAIGAMKLSSDREWLAMEQRPVANQTGGRTAETFDVVVYEATVHKGTTITSCSQLLDVASGGKVVAVVREKQIELWDFASGKKLKAAPFKHKRIDAAQFSPDGKLLALSDRNEL